MGKHAGRPMGARHQDDVRAKIQADRLIQYLQAGIFGTKFQGKDVVLETAKVNAINILLKKTLPDLTATELTGKDGKDLPSGIQVTFVNPASAVSG